SVFTHVQQRLYIFGKTAAAVANAGKDERITDPLIRTDALTHHIHIRTEAFTEIGDLVHKGYFGGKHGVGSILGHFRRSVIHHQNWFTRADKGGVKLLHNFSGSDVVYSNTNPVWFHEIINRCTFFQEFGIGDYVKFDVFTSFR